MKLPLLEHCGTQTGDCETLVEPKAEESHLRRQARIQVADPPTVVLVTDVETTCGLSRSPTWPWPWHQHHLTRALARDMAICVPVGRLAHLSWTTDAETACVWVAVPLSHGQETPVCSGACKETRPSVSPEAWWLQSHHDPEAALWLGSSPFQLPSVRSSPIHPGTQWETRFSTSPKAGPPLDPTAILKQPCDLIQLLSAVVWDWPCPARDFIPQGTRKRRN